MADQSAGYNLTGVHGAEIFRELPEGLRLSLSGDSVGEIVANPADGCYLLLKIVQCPDDESRVGEEEIVYFTDVKGVLDEPSEKGNV